MATWHQQQARTKLYHETKWTVVEDPPNDCMALCLCETEAETVIWQARCKELHPTWSVYILKPASETR